MRAVAVLRRWLCKHECYIEDIRRDAHAESVTCPCIRCGKVLRAAYGLALPCKLRPAP